jgi:hypothetical protein
VNKNIARNYWMIITSPENFEITKGRGFKVQGLKAIHERKIRRVAPGDRLIYYLSGSSCFSATTTVKSTYYEDPSIVWNKEGSSELKLIVDIEPNIILEEENFIKAGLIAYRLDYLRKWAPEDWPLAFMGNLHLLSKLDFILLEGEIKRESDQEGY